jgi:Cu/Ag efflux protein CusF
VDIALVGKFLMREEKRHLISVPTLEEGNYQINWRAISEDGHTIKGEFSFIISPEGVDYVTRQDELLEGEGQIKRIRGPKVTIKHGPIGDLMPAMTMEYLLPDERSLEGFKRGDKVIFKLNSDLEITEVKGK